MQPYQLLLFFFFQLSQELKILHKDVETINFPSQNETIICNGLLRTHDSKTEKLFVEDLAALERLSDDTIFEELKNRMKIGSTYTFIGDILLSMNPNKEFPIHDRKVMICDWKFLAEIHFKK